MRRYAVVLAGVAVLFTAAFVWAGQGTADDKKGLDEALEAWVTAFNAHDAKALAALYTEDADQVTPTGERVKGKAAIEKANVDTFVKNPNVKARLFDVSRRSIAPDVVLEDGRWEESGHTEQGLPTKGLYSTLLVKKQGKWLATCDRSMVPMGK